MTSDLSPANASGGLEPRHSSSSTAVGLLERPEAGSIELSMLETLGFYSDSDEMVVTITEATPPGIAPTLPAPSSRSQVPDLEITGWRPHVIARSKLGRGRVSSFTIVGLTLSLIILVALVASLLQAPAATTARQTSELSDVGHQSGGISEPARFGDRRPRRRCRRDRVRCSSTSIAPHASFLNSRPGMPDDTVPIARPRSARLSRPWPCEPRSATR